jgi:hypothetical protein
MGEILLKVCIWNFPGVYDWTLPNVFQADPSSADVEK